jgi:hypothetical protein
MTPRGIYLGLFLAVLSSHAFAEDDRDQFEQTITCCTEDECEPLQNFRWRHTPSGLDIMMYKDHWCPVRLYYFPLSRSFTGIPTDICNELFCYSMPR